MPTNTAGNTARKHLSYNVQTISNVVNYTAGNGATVIIGTLPAGSMILKPVSGVQVNTAFNAGTANTLNIGFAGSDSFYGSALSLTTVNFVPLDENVTMIVNAATQVQATLTMTGSAATAGSAMVTISYIVTSF